MGFSFLKPTDGHPWAFALVQSQSEIPSQGSDYKLAVVIVVDQLRADYLTRFEDLFVDDGFKLLMKQGAWFTRCYYEHAVTLSGPGHACIATGANPALHGIVNNRWMSQQDSHWVSMDCIADPDVRILGLKGKRQKDGISSKWLRAQTLGGALKSASPASRVESCSLKSLSAVFLAGRKADGAYWWDKRTGRFVSSTYYHRELPDWLTDFNNMKFVDQFSGKTWARLLPSEQYDRFCRQDDASYEGSAKFERGTAFPHPLNQQNTSVPGMFYYKALLDSPYGNDLVLAFARHLIASLHIGRRGVTDIMWVSLSSNDSVGHLYGPYSHEVMDATLRTDRLLADFLKYLDQHIGLKHCLIALTADHGVGMIPEYAQEKGLKAGRLNRGAFVEKLERALVNAFGSSPDSRGYVTGIKMPWLYLDPEVLRQQRVVSEQLNKVVQEVVRDEPGLARVFSEQEIQRDDFVSVDTDELRRFVKNGYYPRRSGQFYLLLTRYWYLNKQAAGHGSAHDYDRHVPLLLFGQGIKPGKYDTLSAPTDLAPTLAHLLKIGPPSKATGRILKEVLNN